VDRSANLAKAAADLCYGASFDWGTLCSTERSVVADLPIKGKLIEALKQQGAFFLDEKQKDLLRRVVVKNGRLNVAQVGQSPATIAKMAGFTVPETTRALVAEVTQVGKAEPLSMETLSPILTFYTEDGWQAGCERCIEVLHFGGIGHTLGLHCTSERVIEAFALEKPAMRIVVNTVAALGSVGYTNALFPAMTLGPGTLGGSIISDNVSPLHLLNIKRLAFETNPLNPAPPSSQVLLASGTTPATAPAAPPATWMDQIEAHLRARAGNPPPAPVPPAPASPAATPSPTPAPYAVAEEEIERLIRQYRKG
jgi:acetaldehyde dehydrogenase (acetylating)